MSGGRPCGLPSNERWLADVSYPGTPPRVPACAGTTVVQRYSSAGTTGVEAFTSSTLTVTPDPDADRDQHPDAHPHPDAHAHARASADSATGLGASWLDLDRRGRVDVDTGRLDSRLARHHVAHWQYEGPVAQQRVFEHGWQEPARGRPEQRGQRQPAGLRLSGRLVGGTVEGEEHRPSARAPRVRPRAWPEALSQTLYRRDAHGHQGGRDVSVRPRRAALHIRKPHLDERLVT